MNSARPSSAVSIPVPATVAVTNIDFHGLLYRGGDGAGGVNVDGGSWRAARAGNAITWTPQPAADNTNAIRWGTTYNFRLDANVAPQDVPGQVTLGMWKTGGPASITASAQVPGVPPPCAVDMDSNGLLEPADVAVAVSVWYTSIQNGTLAGDFD